MPTKHIDNEQWSRIEVMTVDLIHEKKAIIKESDVLKAVIAKGLETITLLELSAQFDYKPRFSVIMVNRIDGYTECSGHFDSPSISDVMCKLESNNPFILCVYGKKSTGRSTFAETMANELKIKRSNTDGVKIYDDAGEADIVKAWQDYAAGGRVILVLYARDQLEATNQFHLVNRIGSMWSIEEPTEVYLSDLPKATSSEFHDLISSTMRKPPTLMRVDSRLDYPSNEKDE
ncbi:hypothetical protein ACP179_01925 (plasmid) [Xenorhabdus stockiae]